MHRSPGAAACAERHTSEPDHVLHAEHFEDGRELSGLAGLRERRGRARQRTCQLAALNVSIMFSTKRPFRKPIDAAKQLGSLLAERIARAASRGVQSMLRTGAHGAPITQPERTVLLFFADVEGDRFVRGDRHVRRALRRLYHSITFGRRVTGFEISFRLLCAALERAGFRVVVNNYALARRHPDHAIGICGYPHILRKWPLPNPAVLGPGLFDHPAQAPNLMNDSRFRSYIVPCGWMYDLFEPYYGCCAIWFGGMDVDTVPDLRSHLKDIDVLVYEKVLWNRDRVVPKLLEPILATLTQRGLRHEVIHYGSYEQSQYLDQLARTKGMLFLCEHETQGLAYQEAMARNVPILAWDQGYWLDPTRERFSDIPVPASSVPYFSPACGERFRNVREFPEALDRFLAGLGSYEPRAYVRDNLSFELSAQAYLRIYHNARGDKARGA